MRNWANQQQRPAMDQRIMLKIPEYAQIYQNTLKKCTITLKKCSFTKFSDKVNTKNEVLESKNTP